MSTCPRCGSECGESANFCASCGAGLPKAVLNENEAMPGAAAETAAGTGAKALIVTLLAMFGFLAAGFFIVATYADRDTDPASQAAMARQIDETLNAANLAMAEAGEGADSKKWQYTTTRDEVRNRDIKIAKITSQNEVNLDPPYQGGSTLSMNVRQHPAYGTDLYFTLSSGQLICRSYSGCFAMVRFDEGPAERFAMAEASDNSSDIVFVDDAGRFVASLKKAKKVVVEVEIYESGRPQFTFATDGLKWPPNGDGQTK